MRKEDVLKLASMPLQSPTFPRGPFRFFDRQYMVLYYRTHPDLIRMHLPEPLEPDGDIVSVQWLDLPDGEGFGAYDATLQAIPCTLNGMACSFIVQMYVDNCPPLAGGREIWGYPMKFGCPSLKVQGDTLTGTLQYAREQVAMGTMVYKHTAFSAEPMEAAKKFFERTQVTLKIIPGIDGRPAIAQLVGVNMEQVNIQGAWTGAGRLELVSTVNCPLADLPVDEPMGGLHMVTSMTLPYGRVLHDYLAN